MLLEAGPGEPVCCPWSPEPWSLHVVCCCFLPLRKWPGPGADSRVADQPWWWCCGAWRSGGHGSPGSPPAASLLLLPGSQHVPLPRPSRAFLLQDLAPTPQPKGPLTGLQHPSVRHGGQADSGQVGACILTGAEANSVLSHYVSWL